MHIRLEQLARCVAAGRLDEIKPSAQTRALCKAGFEDVPIAPRWKHVVVALHLVMGNPLMTGERQRETCKTTPIVRQQAASNTLACARWADVGPVH